MRAIHSTLSFLPALSLVAIVACGGDTPPAASPTASAAPGALVPAATKPESDKVTWKDDPSAKSCHTAKNSGDLTAQVTAMASGCLDTTKLHQVGSPTTGEGTGTADTMVKTVPLAAKANHCYRVIGLAETTVTDFDVAVMDSSGKSAGEDGTDSNDAVVRDKGFLCFTQDDTVNVNAAVATGKGKWALEIWSD